MEVYEEAEFQKGGMVCSLLPALQGRDVLSVVNMKVTHELGDSGFSGEMGKIAVEEGMALRQYKHKNN